MSNNAEFSGTSAPSYEAYDQDHSYEYDNGLVVMPVAGRTAGHKVIRLHGGIGMRRISFDAHRRGKPPIVPTMIDTNWDTFIGGTVTAALPIPNPQLGGYNWRVRGQYMYVQRKPRVVGNDPIPTGGYPFAVAPNDALATAIVSATPKINTAAANTDPNVNTEGAIAEAAGDSLVDHDADTYLWPFTMMPTTFSSDNLLGS